MKTLKKKKKKIFFLGRLPLLPETNIGRNFGSWGEYFAQIALKLSPWGWVGGSGWGGVGLGGEREEVSGWGGGGQGG